MSILVLRANFLAGCYHGSSDWPPAPMRLFQALLAGCADHYRGRGLPPELVHAFRWLERQQPPEIHAPGAMESSRHQLFVPNNNADTAPGVAGQRDPSILTSKTVGRRYAGRVTYVWNIGEDGAMAALIATAAKHLCRLGRGIDAAYADAKVLAESPPIQSGHARYRPGGSGGTALRVPVAGSYDSLELRYQAWLGRMETQEYLPRESLWEVVRYGAGPTAPRKLYSGYTLHRPDRVRWFAWPQWNTVTVAAMIRHAVMNRFASEPGLQADISGHRGKSHPFWLPLPSVGHRHADGLIRRAIVACGPDVSQETFHEIRHRVRHGAVLTRHGRELAWMSEMEAVDEGQDGVFQAYLKPAKEWVTVTPVVLPGYDSHGQKAEKLLLKALRHAGYEEEMVADLQYQRTPFLPSSVWAGEYRVPEYLSYTRTHVRVRFRMSVPGPLAIGAGAHYGLGLMAQT